MREIKFRAWHFDPHDHLEGKEWVGKWQMVQVCSLHIGTQKVIVPGKGGNYSQAINDKCILMQFTGLHDKNGKEIYEGDIVRLYGNSLATVEWIDRAVRMVGFAAIHRKAGDERVIDTADVKNFAQEMARAEIIGNIWENGDLLKP